jgi:hypothetical protein
MLENLHYPPKNCPTLSLKKAAGSPPGHQASQKSGRRRYAMDRSASWWRAMRARRRQRLEAVRMNHKALAANLGREQSARSVPDDARETTPYTATLTIAERLA